MGRVGRVLWLYSLLAGAAVLAQAAGLFYHPSLARIEGFLTANITDLGVLMGRLSGLQWAFALSVAGGIGFGLRALLRPPTWDRAPGFMAEKSLQRAHPPTS